MVFCYIKQKSKKIYLTIKNQDKKQGIFNKNKILNIKIIFIIYLKISKKTCKVLKQTFVLKYHKTIFKNYFQ